MKALIKFLLQTGVGREITKLIFALAIRMFKRKVLEKMDPYKRDNLRQALEIAELELHDDVEAGKVVVKDLI